MEILAENVHSGIHVFILILATCAGIFFGLLMVVGIVSIIKDGISGVGEIFVIVIISIITAFMIFAVIVGINEGPDVTFEAIITDFNEVYSRGYEIIEQRGQIYVLKERE